MSRDRGQPLLVNQCNLIFAASQSYISIMGREATL